MRVLDTDIDIEANMATLIARYKVYFFLVVYSAVLDGISTVHFMSRIGPGYECNLFVRNLSYTCGIIIGPIIGKMLQVLAVWLIAMFTPNLIRPLCVTVFLANCYAFVVNMQI
jgi:hypothetical protein